MKKYAVMAMLVVAANFLSPLMPAAHAATIDDVLAQLAVAQNPNAAQVQQVIALKQEFEQGGRGAIVSRVAQAALERADQGKYAGLATAVASGGDYRTTFANTVRQEITTQVAARLGPDGTGLNNVLAQLLQNTGLFPSAALDNNILTATGGNAPQILQ